MGLVLDGERRGPSADQSSTAGLSCVCVIPVPPQPWVLVLCAVSGHPAPAAELDLGPATPPSLPALLISLVLPLGLPTSETAFPPHVWFATLPIGCESVVICI